ncbi:polysaccharide lyase family 7 protein [Nemania serpens]|nr:polysaccharide lyase family 7 protein [Nemania serpens]
MAPVNSLLSLLLLPLISTALDPSCSPGGNFDLTSWNLQLPTGSAGSVDTIRASALKGCAGYKGPTFFTDPKTSAIVLLAPGNPAQTGCATTSGSEHCRTELREVVPSSGSNAAWSPAGTNILRVSMTVVSADDGSHGTAIGQVFASAASKPILEMYYSQAGKIVAGVKPNPDGNQIVTQVGTVPVGTPFDYVLEYSKNVLSVTISGKKTQLSTYDWGSPASYFKAGNYNQAKSAVSSEVHISALSVTHS